MRRVSVTAAAVVALLAVLGATAIVLLDRDNGAPDEHAAGAADGADTSPAAQPAPAQSTAPTRSAPLTPRPGVYTGTDDHGAPVRFYFTGKQLRSLVIGTQTLSIPDTNHTAAVTGTEWSRACGGAGWCTEGSWTANDRAAGTRWDADGREIGFTVTRAYDPRHSVFFGQDEWGRDVHFALKASNSSKLGQEHGVILYDFKLAGRGEFVDVDLDDQPPYLCSQDEKWCYGQITFENPYTLHGYVTNPGTRMEVEWMATYHEFPGWEPPPAWHSDRRNPRWHN